MANSAARTAAQERVIDKLEAVANIGRAQGPDIRILMTELDFASKYLICQSSKELILTYLLPVHLEFSNSLKILLRNPQNSELSASMRLISPMNFT